MSTHETPNEIQVTEQELASMTGALVAAHEESFPRMLDSVTEWTANPAGAGRPDSPAGPLVRPFSRRGFLATAGSIAAGGLVLAAAGPAGASLAPGRASAAGLAPAARRRAATVPLDVSVAALAASLENLAVATYTAGLTAAAAGKLGKVPPAVGTFATTARAQHAQHAAAWNAVVRSAGYRPVKVVDPVIGRVVNTDLASVTNVAGLLELALTLENVAGATYLEAIEAVSSIPARKVAASIQPVEMQHAAILNFVLGRYPVPSGFATLAGAAPVSDVDHITIARA